MAEKKVYLSNKEFLEEKGFLFDFSFFCFDYFYEIKKGKFKGKKLLIKRVKDANTITKKSYEYLITFSALTNSIPLIIADNYNIKNKLKDDVLYYFKSVPMMNEKTLNSLLNEGKLFFIHKHSAKPIIKENEIGESVINSRTLNKIKEEFEKIKKELNDYTIEIRKLVDYYFNPKDLFVKETKRFEYNKEKKIIDFSNLNNKAIVFISNAHNKIIEKENFIVFPKKEIKDLMDLIEKIEEFFI
jgi:hypothetical protein